MSKLHLNAFYESKENCISTSHCNSKKYTYDRPLIDINMITIMRKVHYRQFRSPPYNTVLICS